MEASLCRRTSPVIYINGPLCGEVVREENLVMDGRLNTHDMRCEEEMRCTVIVRGGGKRAMSAVVLLFYLFIYFTSISKKGVVVWYLLSCSLSLFAPLFSSSRF